MIITLLTDFGTRDTFAGVLHGVIKTIAPGADVITLTHHVPPQDIAIGAFLWKTAARYFPVGTIHLGIVDPGVGGARRPVAAHIGDAVYVCPDNGLLSYVLSENIAHRAVTLDNTVYQHAPPSRTFHGRDIFAPAAAYLARGVPLHILGTRVTDLHTFPLSVPDIAADSVTCHVLYADVYGNVLTDLTEDLYNTWRREQNDIKITVRGRHIRGPVAAYSDVSMGQSLAIFGSSGHLEIAVRDGSAQAQLLLGRGDSVHIRRTPCL